MLNSECSVGVKNKGRELEQAWLAGTFIRKLGQNARKNTETSVTRVEEDQRSKMSHKD